MVAAGDFVPIAEVVKAVGLKGEFKLYPLLDWFPPLLASRFLVWESGRPVTVVRSRPVGETTVVLVAGCDDRDAAEGQVGRRIGFRPADYLEPDFPRPEAGLPFRFLGREVQLVSGQTIGPVVEVRRYGGQITLVVERDRTEVLIPAVEPILRRADGLVGPLRIDPPEGLLDVAAD